MNRPVDALVTGFTKSPGLAMRSLAPLRRLRQEGIIRSIRCVTWGGAETEEYVAVLRSLRDVQVTRLRQPDASGTGNQRGVVYQIENLKAALALVADEPLILKWRPDFVAQIDFLRGKILGFESQSVVPPRDCFGVTMPAPVFQQKIWLPWADSNTPFFFEDAAFLGAKRDVALLAAALNPADREILGDPACGAYAHVVRYAKVFVGAYPLLRNYLKSFRNFRSDADFRQQLIPYLTENGFFWHVMLAHAWILYSQFHVDAGGQGDLAFYANAANRGADWSDFAALRTAHPYDNIASWRDGAKAGTVFPSVSRVFGRLVDDAWARALFTTGVSDLPQDQIAAMLANIAGCGDGRLAGIESQFYQGLARLSAQHPPVALAG